MANSYFLQLQISMAMSKMDTAVGRGQSSETTTRGARWARERGHAGKGRGALGVCPVPLLCGGDPGESPPLA